MKTSTSPSESRFDSALSDNAIPDNVLMDAVDDAYASAAANEPVAAQTRRPLDSTTRESLSRLAQLINVREPEEGIETQKRPMETPSASSSGVQAQVARTSVRQELPPRQVLSIDAFPALAKLERCFDRIARERGSQIYGRQKAKDVVQTILDELERRHYESLGKIDLESTTDSVGGTAEPLDLNSLNLTPRRAVA